MFMKRLFSFNAKQECSTLLVVISKVVKVIYIVLACVAALIMLIGESRRLKTLFLFFVCFV